jgi:DNA-binding response OmpR family regulator
VQARANRALIGLCDKLSAVVCFPGKRTVLVNVLVAESEESMAEPLRRAGHDVTVARNGRDLCSLTTSGSFDAVVVGMLGSGSQGLRVCNDLRRRGVALPIVLIVGHDDVESRIQGLDAGADDCVGVGCPADELLARLRALVRRVSLQVNTG